MNATLEAGQTVVPETNGWSGAMQTSPAPYARWTCDGNDINPMIRMRFRDRSSSFPLDFKVERRQKSLLMNIGFTLHGR